MKVSIRADSVLIEGYVNAVERNSKPLLSRIGRFIERVCKGAFERAIQRNDDIHVLLNHDWDRDLGSTRQGNLELVEDSIGLHARATITDPEVMACARRGCLVGWSFGFTDTPDGVERSTDEETGLPLRKVRDLNLYEVSILDTSKTPAYDGTLIMARSDDDVQFHSEPFEDGVEVDLIEIRDEDVPKRDEHPEADKVIDYTQNERSERSMKELIEKKNDLITRAEDVLNLAKTEKRELTEAEAEELAEIRDNVRKIVETLKLDEEFKDMEKMEVKEDDTPKEKEVEVTEEQRAMAVEQQEREAFENFIRGQMIHERAGELTPATSGSNIGLGGALIPETIVNNIISKVYDICPILDKSQKFNVKGTLDVPYYPADSQNITVAYQTEFQQMASSSGSFATVSLTGFLAGALTKVSRSLINNVDFDIVNYVIDEMALAIKRFVEHELLIGTSGKVTGLSTLSNLITTASGTAITAEEVIDLHDSIKDEFQQNAIWIMSPKTRTALRKLKSTTGYFLLNDDISTPFGTSILGKPVFVSDNMPEMEAGKVAIFYGDMRGLATKFNEEINIEILRERYADEHAVGVIGWLEFDAKVIDEQQIAGLKMAGTPASE